MASAEETRPTSSTRPAPPRELVESLDQVLFLVAADLKQVYYLSPAYERLTGRSIDDVFENPRAWMDSVYEADRERVIETVAKRASGELQGQTEMEYRIRTPGGDIRWVRSLISPVPGDTGAVQRLAGSLEDITERKRGELIAQESRDQLARQVELRTRELSDSVTQLKAEIEQRKHVECDLRRSEARFRQLFEANIVGVLFSDIYGNIFDANEAFLEMTGYTRSDLPMRWDKMTPPEWIHLSEMAIQQLHRGETVPPWEKEYFRKDGSLVPVLIGVALLDRETGECVSFVIDLTSRKLAEEQLREVNLQLEHASRLSVMGELLADMAHEIHQPLGVIVNYANGTLRRLKKGELTVGALKDRLREIAAESMRVAEVLRRIREFIRRREPERKSVNLNSVVMDSLQLTRLERREHRVSVIFRPDRDLPPVQADRVQITQVLVNLVLNAVHAVSGRDTPKILITTSLNEAGLAEVLIADNGPGVSAADIPHIFDRFFTTKSGGLGLGLPISRSIVESHAGQLWYASKPGESATFRMTLSPQKTPQKPDEPEAEPSVPSGQSEQ